MAKVVVFGEPMLEISQSGAQAQLGFGGDTFNTAVYMARLGLAPHYITAIGRDHHSDSLIAYAEAEGIQTQSILRHPNRLPGIYSIQTDNHGERSFCYWRDKSAARAFFHCEEAGAIMASAANADLLYLSGISLSILGSDDQLRLRKLARAVRSRGGRVAFDPNYRPNGWASQDTARRAMEMMAPHCNLVLPTLGDENALYGPQLSHEHAARWLRAGAGCVIMKCGEKGAIIFQQDLKPIASPIIAPVDPTDTTGAGDSFNAGFLAALLCGRDVETACVAGHQLARQVIQHHGAIIPRKDKGMIALI